MIQLAPGLVIVAALFAGHPIHVECQATLMDGDSGYADYATHTIVVQNPVCRGVNGFARNPTLSVDTEVWSGSDASLSFSMVILLHETQHFAHPDYSEAQVNCAALGLLPRFARILGASVKTSRLARRYARMWIHELEPAEYQSACTR